MSNDTPTEPVRPTGGGEPAPAQRPPAPPPTSDAPVSEKPSFRDRFRRVGGDGSSRTFGLAALLASTLAALIVGGLGGAAISAGLDDDDHGDRGDRMSERHGPGAPGDRHR